MRLEYVTVPAGKVLDVVTLDGSAPLVYATGRARGVAESIVRRAGREALPGWTNGYVQFRRPLDAP